MIKIKEDTSVATVGEFYDNNDTYVRSNFMISSKYRSTLFSNRLMAISLSRLGTARESSDGYLTVTVKGKDIQNMLGVKSNNFFKELSKTAHGMTGQTIGWSNPETQEFEYIAVVTKAMYKDGDFTVDFHKDIKNFLTDLKNSYTKFSLSVMLSFKSTYSFRLYELLRSRAYYKKGDERGDNLFKIEFDTNELRLDLGVVNAEVESVRRVLDGKRGADPEMWEKAVAASPEKTYSTWKDFKRFVLDKAIEEINEKPETGLFIHKMEPKKAGRGGKVYGVTFFVEKSANKKKKESVELKEVDELDLLDEIRDIVPGIKNTEARAIGQAASWNMALIREKYDLASTQNVNNLVGWLIEAIKGDYQKPIKKGKIIDPGFKQREYDFDALQKEVLQGKFG